MTWLQFILLVIISGIVQFIIAYYKEKGKNLAQKEDIGKITKEIKAVEVKFINETEKLKTALSLITNIQTDIASIERNTIIELNKALFIFLDITTSGNIRSCRNNTDLDEYLDKLNDASERASESIILFKLFIDDNQLKKQANDLFVEILKMETERYIDILELKDMNEHYESTKNDKDLEIRQKREKLSKLLEKHKMFIEKMYDKQIKKYTEISDLASTFQQNCRKYIYRLIEKPEA